MNFEPIQAWWLEWEWMEGWRRVLELGQRQKATLLQTIAPFHILSHWHKLHFESISITRTIKKIKRPPPQPFFFFFLFSLPLSTLHLYLLSYTDVCNPLTFDYYQQKHVFCLSIQTILDKIRLRYSHVQINTVKKKDQYMERVQKKKINRSVKLLLHFFLLIQDELSLLWLSICCSF